MSDLDKQIRSGLSAAPEDVDYDITREDSLRELLMAGFRGRTKWMGIIAWIDGLVFTGVMVFAAVRFFQVDGTRELILYATIFLASALVIALVKLWYWMLFNRNSIKREVKRLELRVAEMIEKLEAK